MSVIRGDAGFKYVPVTATGTVTHALQMPLRNVSFAESRARYSWWSADLTTRNAITVGGHVDEVVADIRAESDVEGLRAALRNGLDGQTLTYFPSLAATGTFFPIKLVSVNGSDTAIDLPQDADRWFDRRVQCSVRMRRVDGGSLASIITAT